MLRAKALRGAGGRIVETHDRQCEKEMPWLAHQFSAEELEAIGISVDFYETPEGQSTASREILRPDPEMLHNHIIICGSQFKAELAVFLDIIHSHNKDQQVVLLMDNETMTEKFALKVWSMIEETSAFGSKVFARSLFIHDGSPQSHYDLSIVGVSNCNALVFLQHPGQWGDAKVVFNTLFLEQEIENNVSMGLLAPDQRPDILSELKDTNNIGCVDRKGVNGRETRDKYDWVNNCTV